MTIGLFGGSFNPPHLAHLIVAETIRDRAGLDEVWWMPARTPPHKRGEAAEELTAAEHRLAMTERAVASNPSFRVHTLDLERDGPSYTADTVRILQERRPEDRFYLVIGSDSLAGLPSWHRPEAIVDRVELLVYPRPGVDLSGVPERFREAASFVDVPRLGISGTAIREDLAAGRSVRYRVPEAVRAYIDRHGLYR